MVGIEIPSQKAIGKWFMFGQEGACRLHCGLMNFICSLIVRMSEIQQSEKLILVVRVSPRLFLTYVVHFGELLVDMNKL